MEDIVAVKLRDRNRGDCAFLTGGRVYDAVDEGPLLAALGRIAPMIGFHDVESISICYDLGEVQDHIYFYEGLLDFAVRMATEPFKSEKWAAEQRNDGALFKSIYQLGPRRMTS